MSVINKMLQDLDRRQALGAVYEKSIVRAPEAKPASREWFWRVLVALLAAVLLWAGWVALQLMPRKPPLVTERAFQAAAEARSRPAPKPAQPAAPVVAEQPRVVAEQPKASEVSPQPVETLRLAMQLETPVQEKQEKPAAAKPRPKPAAAAPAPSPAANAVVVDKRDRERTPTDAAEGHFRRAALLLGHGRVSEAEGELAAALRADPAHGAARQAYVALLLEQGRLEPAQRLLREALELNPEQPTLALAAARILAGQRQYHAALEVLDRAGAAPGNADFLAMRGAVLQRLGRHGDAVAAYQQALQAGGAQPATTWVGLAISLESLGRRNEAASAYRRALAAGPLAQEAREYAENRARALE
ncbi:MAG TPA: tetratricopeptide repeat protein [Burkholderiales bacterium]|nr:tetratricopeptide repeat protein [Burkholderiales bacterium]